MIIPDNRFWRFFIKKEKLPLEIKIPNYGPSFKLPRFLKNEKSFLFLVLSLFLLISCYKLNEIPGLFEDEGFPGFRAKQSVISQSLDPEITNLMPTSGPYSIYPVFLFFLIFDISVFSLRFSTVLISTFSLVFSYLFVKEFFNKDVAKLSLVLHAFFPGFIVFSRFGGWAHSYYMLPVSMVLYFFSKCMKTRETKFIYLAAFLIGFGINIHIIFLYFVLALLISIKLFSPIQTKIRKKNVFVFVLVLFFSSLPYTSYQIKNILNEIINPTGDPYGNILNHMMYYGLESREGINNLNFLGNLNIRTIMLNRFLSGDVNNLVYFDLLTNDMMLIDFHICNYSLRNPLLSLTFWISLFYFISISKLKPSKEEFVLFLFLFMFMELCFTTSDFLKTHFLLFFPLPFMIIAFSLNKAISETNLIIYLIITLLIINFFVIFDYYSCLETTGGNRDFSTEINNLVEYLDNSNAERCVFLNWGLFHNILFLSSEEKISNMLNFRLDMLEKTFTEKQLLETFDNETVFIISENQHYFLFYNITKNVGKTIEIEKEFLYTNNQSLYTVYKIK